MEAHSDDSRALLDRALASGRLHSAYLLSGAGAQPRAAALAFARGLVCEGQPPPPCERCRACRLSSETEPLALDGTGRGGPLLRHVGDHPDLLWIERGAADTRVRIGQIRALQHALRLRGEGPGRRAAVIADAEWLNAEAQNALLRLLEEPPPRTTLVLIAATSAGLLATLRSRCQRVPFRAAETTPEAGELRALRERLDALAGAPLPELLEWAEQYRGARGQTADAVRTLLEVSAGWLRERVREAVRSGSGDLRRALVADREISACRKSLDQRNANSQMVAERALLVVREALR